MNTFDDYKFIDIHYHASPDLYIRRWHALEAGKIYQTMNGAVVLKSHLGATSIQASLAQKMGLPVFASLVLNHIAGGINYQVILRSLSEYQPVINSKMIVHFPTITGRTIQSKLTRTLSHAYLSKHTLNSETLFDTKHQLRKEVFDILKMASDFPIILSTGHASKEEVYSLIDACIQYNVPALLLNQPANPLTGLNASALKELTKNEFIWIEQTALTYLLGHQDEEDFSEVLTSVPRVIYSSDLGQTSQMDVMDWFDYSKQMFTKLQLSEQRQKEILHKNASALLGAT
ncbi:DUF6282 family protein [Legionella fallonii]|uniref:Amidohydrolase-related domain-containing protein n=1 Tax=Legionella fallonii LLAP-10 TaxID=1212491 RepID=A0A098G1J6_9GAMM|nr:DUF6282 family protein [Legionella fallonii]CEG55849.1 conserved protein of unknown function [Legionella fallonii LLAP-10]